MFLNKASFYGEKSASCPTLKPDGHPLSAVRYCSFDIFAANLPFPLSATCGRTMLWGQGPTYHGTFLITPLVSSKSHLASNCTFIETKYTSLLHACIRMPVTSINAFSFNTGIIMLFLPQTLACAVCGLLFPSVPCSVNSVGDTVRSLCNVFVWLTVRALGPWRSRELNSCMEPVLCLDCERGARGMVMHYKSWEKRGNGETQQLG